MQHSNLVGRAARWSASHKKTAIFGWLAFVLASIALGGAIGEKEMTTADQYPGASGQAQQALEDSRLEPNTEMVIVQSKDGSRTIRSAAFRSTVEELTTGLSQVPHVKDVRSPLEGEAPVTKDGRSARPTGCSCWCSSTGSASRCWGSSPTAASCRGCRCSCS